MSKLWPGKRFLSFAACVWILSPLHVAKAGGEFERHVAEAVRLYDDLEYELALEQLERARGSLKVPGDRVTLALYKGIISADMGRWQVARDEFRAALLLDPDARLPLRVSPKVSREFEAQRARAVADLAFRRKDAPTVEAGDLDGKEGQVESIAELPGTLKPSVVPAPPGPISARQREVESSASWLRIGDRQVPLASLALLGAGLVAGGTGAGFGLSSRGQLADARKAQFHDQLVEHHGRAQRSARTANVLFGVAAGATAGAVATWLLWGELDGATSKVGGAR
ncbi:hypothetical protein [Comamonas sp. JC664]|uniref:hypothetical protein n=1 Tax=Comamonas sp. JC664 TaxID=2801917 RepID=UPI0017494889|nr:hypothetical protein [Comamonas sp. JC664]MBL0698259.1 hypothetical protein [Comamonas sp. JC664]GHG89227.1 hypothetical protein GCM10012319_48470 [Comamonas sp. KCTC 72670]